MLQIPMFQSTGPHKSSHALIKLSSDTVKAWSRGMPGQEIGRFDVRFGDCVLLERLWWETEGENSP